VDKERKEGDASHHRPSTLNEEKKIKGGKGEEEEEEEEKPQPTKPTGQPTSKDL